MEGLMYIILAVFITSGLFGLAIALSSWVWKAIFPPTRRVIHKPTEVKSEPVEIKPELVTEVKPKLCCSEEWRREDEDEPEPIVKKYKSRMQEEDERFKRIARMNGGMLEGNDMFHAPKNKKNIKGFIVRTP